MPNCDYAAYKGNCPMQADITRLKMQLHMARLTNAKLEKRDKLNRTAGIVDSCYVG